MNEPGHQPKDYVAGLVSVIIPFLNHGNWLKQAIESVIRQSYGFWEMILVDDGSEEADSIIARAYSLQYPGKILYTDHPGHENRGVTISRNLGISLSRGSYIAFLDSDDCWLPRKLEQQLALYKHYPEATMICEASLFWYSWKDPALEDIVIPVGAEPDRVYDPPELIRSVYPLGEGAPPCPTGIIITREAFERSGGFEPAFTGINQLYEDQAFLTKIYLREKVFVSGVLNNLYRKREGSLSQAAGNSSIYHKVRTFFLSWLEEYLVKHGLGDPGIRDLIEKAREAMALSNSRDA